MSDTSRTPLSVIAARAALTRLAAEDAGLAARMKTLLPGYAVRCEQRGEAYDVETLLAAARRGPDALKTIFSGAAAPKDLLAQYRALFETLNPPQPRRAQLPDPTAAFAFGPEIGITNELMVNRDAMVYSMGHGMPPAGGPMDMRLMHSDYLRRQQDNRAFYNMRADVFREKDAGTQLAKALRVIDRCTPHQASDFIDTALRSGSFELLKHMVPAAVGRDPGLQQYVQVRFLPRALSLLPHSEEMLLHLADCRKIWTAAMRTDFLIGAAASPHATESLLGRLVETAPAAVNASEWSKVVHGATPRFPQIARLALARIDPADDRGRMLQENLSLMVMRVALHGPSDLLDDVLAHPALRHISWPLLFRNHAATLSAPAMKRIAVHADAVAPDWSDDLTVNDLPAEKEEMQAYLECLPDKAIERLMPALVQSLSRTRNGASDTAMTALAAHPAFARLDVWKTLQALRQVHGDLDMLMQHIDLGRLDVAQRSELLLILVRETYSRGDAVTRLLESGPCTQDSLDRAFYVALKGVNITNRAAAAYSLGRHGAGVGENIPANLVAQYESFKPHYDRWMKVQRAMPPEGLETKDPAPFRPALFATLCRILKSEAYAGGSGHEYAYNAMALFQSEERVMQYLKKWAKAGRQPLHNLIQMIRLPDDLSGVNLADWGDAVLRHGPEMAKLVKFGRDIPSPAKSEDGGGWSLARTREIAAQFAYARGAEHKALAALCHAHSVSEAHFDQALNLVLYSPPHQKNLPEIDIDGADFGLAGARFRRLASDDVRGLFLGELTDCCQSIGGHGSKCAHHGFTSPDGGFYVIETAKGEIIGQTWAWRGQQGELVFDSLEMLKGRVSPEQWLQLAQAAAALLQKNKARHDVTALHIGAGGETPSAFGGVYARANGLPSMSATRQPPERPEAAQPKDYAGYRDSSSQYVIWRKQQKVPRAAAQKRNKTAASRL